MDIHGVGKGDGVADVVGLGFGALGVQVHKHNFTADVAHDHGVGCGRADETCANNPNLDS